MNQVKTSSKKKVWNIISWVLVGIVFFIAAFGLFLRFRRNQVYFFGKRYDAVLSKSMATTNKVIRAEYEEKGWTNQFKKGALLVSTKIEKDTELKAGDIVLFVNPDNNKITAHRIVKVGYNGIENIYTIRADAAKPGEEDGGRAFLKSELQSKVIKSVPFVGYIAGYLTSFWGITAEAGVIVVFVVYEFIKTKKEEKEKSAQIETQPSGQSSPVQNEVEVEVIEPRRTSNGRFFSSKKKEEVEQPIVEQPKVKPFKEETKTEQPKPIRSSNGRFVSKKKNENDK